MAEKRRKRRERKNKEEEEEAQWKKVKGSIDLMSEMVLM